MDKRIIRFCRLLQDQPVGPNVNNFYAAKRTNKQRHNLQQYLSQLMMYQPIWLCVGEAPGYNGCARTGVPFSSERLLRDGVLNGRMFGTKNGYYINESEAVHEQSAAAMWELLETLEQVPLIWNAFPFHPYQRDNLQSNRKPNVNELLIGEDFLERLIEIYRIEHIVAIGNSADNALTRVGYVHSKVRHPSYGGKKEFMAGMQKLLKE